MKVAIIGGGVFGDMTAIHLADTARVTGVGEVVRMVLAGPELLDGGSLSAPTARP